MTDEHPTPSEIESYIQQLDTDEWAITDYQTSYGMDDTTTVTVEVEYHPPARNSRQIVKDVKETIDRLGAENGVEYERVVDELSDATHPYSVADVEHEIEKLKQKGEVYSPRENHLRTT